MIDPIQLEATIDAETSALLIVDVQNGFCHPEGELGRLGRGTALQAVVPRIVTLSEAAAAAGIRRYFSRQEHDPNDVTRQNHRIPTHISKANQLPGLKNTWDAEIIDDLKQVIHPEDYIFVKHRASCFYCTTLEVQLRMDGITCLIVAGVTTNYCVDSTIRDAYARDFDVIVVGDCCAARDEQLHHATLKNAAIFHGIVRNHDEVVQAFSTIASGS